MIYLGLISKTIEDGNISKTTLYWKDGENFYSMMYPTSNAIFQGFAIMEAKMPSPKNQNFCCGCNTFIEEKSPNKYCGRTQHRTCKDCIKPVHVASNALSSHCKRFFSSLFNINSSYRLTKF